MVQTGPYEAGIIRRLGHDVRGAGLALLYHCPNNPSHLLCPRFYGNVGALAVPSSSFRHKDDYFETFDLLSSLMLRTPDEVAHPLALRDWMACRDTQIPD